MTTIGVDLDGTVLDCRPRQQAVLLRLCPEAESHVEEIWTRKRQGASTRAALSALGIVPNDGFAQNWLDLIEDPESLVWDETLPKAKPALERMSETCDLHLITARQSPSGVFETLNRLDLSRLFSHVEVVAPGKAAHEAKAAHLRAARALAHCGDTEVDGKAAKAAGMPFWAVSCGQRSAEHLTTHSNPSRIFASLADVASDFERLLKEVLT